MQFDLRLSILRVKNVPSEIKQKIEKKLRKNSFFLIFIWEKNLKNKIFFKKNLLVMAHQKKILKFFFVSNGAPEVLVMAHQRCATSIWITNGAPEVRHYYLLLVAC